MAKNLVPEEFGGETLFVEISAKEAINMDVLEESGLIFRRVDTLNRRVLVFGVHDVLWISPPPPPFPPLFRDCDSISDSFAKRDDAAHRQSRMSCRGHWFVSLCAQLRSHDHGEDFHASL
mgnify:CR=1 FL=1